VLENPTGYLRKFLGKQTLTFEPWWYGDNYQKKTDLWGEFETPKRIIDKKPRGIIKFSMLKSKDIHPEYYGKLKRKERRAITPRGFAEAFYKANT
jgi:hypothetical protein